jgi:hypothetical protein
MSKSESAKDVSASENIDRLIAGLADWRGKTLASIRKAILEVDREIVEEWKWMGSPVWSRAGNIVVGNAHKDKVKPAGSRKTLQQRFRRQGVAGDRCFRG